MAIILPTDIECSHMFRTMWQGSKPAEGPYVRDAGFDCLVLCEDTFQPPDSSFPGVEVHRCPYKDNYNPSDENLEAVEAAAKQVVEWIRQEKRILVVCHAGLNRSGLVSAMAIHLLTGVNGRVCASWVRSHRENALTNFRFYEIMCLRRSTRTDIRPLHELEFEKT